MMLEKNLNVLIFQFFFLFAKNPDFIIEEDRVISGINDICIENCERDRSHRMFPCQRFFEKRQKKIHIREESLDNIGSYFF